MAGEIDLQMISEVRGRVQARPPCQSLKLCSKKRPEKVGSRFIVAGRFDLDQFTNCADHLVTLILEIVKAVAP